MTGGPGRHRPNAGGLRRSLSPPSGFNAHTGQAARASSSGIVMPGVTIGQTHISTLPTAVMRPENRRPETGLKRDTRITPMKP